ncbi:MAG: hypothetical protein MZV49_21640 [Rhodopseudomonas palustris]|nr:hypothetical protein [Rhodopseudomonas palustris]
MTPRLPARRHAGRGRRRIETAGRGRGHADTGERLPGWQWQRTVELSRIDPARAPWRLLRPDDARVRSP